MKKIIALAAITFLSACGNSHDASVLNDDTSAAAAQVSVSKDGAGKYSAALTGAAAAQLGASLVQTSYQSAQGGLTIACAAGCSIAVDTAKEDLANVHRPEDEGNHDLLQVRLTGAAAKDFYLGRTSAPEKFLSNDLGLKTYAKAVLTARSEGAAADVSCFKKVTPYLIFLTTTRYECVIGLSGYAAL